MARLLLNTTEETKLIEAFYPSIKQDSTDNQSFVITASYHSSDGGGSSQVLGVFLSKEKAVKAFLKRVKDEFNGKNAAELLEESEIYFEEEPELEHWNGQYTFQCKNPLYDDYVWSLSLKTIGEMTYFE